MTPEEHVERLHSMLLLLEQMCDNLTDPLKTLVEIRDVVKETVKLEGLDALRPHS